MPTLSEAFAIATAHHRAGRLDLAEQIYRRILEAEPDHADALHRLGLIAQQAGRHAAAIECLGRAAALDPGSAAYQNSLGEAYRAAGRIEEAVACYRRSLGLKPDLAEAHNNLGIALLAQGRAGEAVACFRRALEIAPGFAVAQSNLGGALQRLGKLDEAVAGCRRAVQLAPQLVNAHNNLGEALRARGELDEAVACYRRALALEPDLVEVQSNLGCALQRLGKLDEAVACYRRALELAPGDAETLSNLGTACKDQGRLDEAVACFRRALELVPDHAGNHSNLLYTLSFCPDQDAPALYREHRRWNERHAQPLAKQIRPHLNDRSPERRLRIGYVSPDFRFHPVGRFLLPLLEAHDHRDFEIFGYCSVQVPDAITAACRASADVWREATALSDEQLADAVRSDRIDVLVDLSMHMERNRLLVFARKPAPVQVTYLAYCGTTGLTAIDYRLTDPHLDPPGRDEAYYSERSIRLPETYWCYRPGVEAPPPGVLPALGAGHVTFGCLNNFCKVTPPVLAAWCRLLQAVPRSRFVLHSHRGTHRQRVRDLLAEQGVDPQRLTLVDQVPIMDYLRTYQRIDVALDTFPYGGGTTTCDALWMGVPVVSLTGQTAVGRGGASILSNVGLPELVAGDADAYVRIAAELAGDLPRLAGLRATLRDRLQKSPLMDAPRFARGVESAYRRMWRGWCAR